MRGRCSKIDVVDRHIGGRIRTRRRCIGVTIEQLADHLELTYGQLQKNETGRAHVPIERLYSIAQALGVSIGYFFEGLEDKNVLPFRQADVSFDMLAEHFVHLRRSDQRILVEISRLLARRDASCPKADLYG